MVWDKQTILTKLQVPQEEEEAEVWQTTAWLNRDNVPLPSSRRTWGIWAYAGFWITSGVNVSGWAGGASFMALGLTVSQSMLVSVIGGFLVAAVVWCTGQLGSHWHVGFPMWNRIVWGMRASYFPLINRIILSFTWCATQGWLGAQCLKTLIGSIIPGIYTMKNTMPVSTGMTSADFLCFVLFTLITAPLLLIPPEKLRIPMVVVASCSTLTAFIMFIWSLVRAGGGGPLLHAEGLALVGVEAAKGPYLVWAIFHGFSAALGGICAGIFSMSDYTRFARRPNDPLVSQAIIAPITGTLTTIIGLICASSAAKFYPTEPLLWTPYGLLTAIQMHENTKGARAAVFFASLVFTLAQLGINIPGNCLSGGIDLASMLPKYINIRRGAYITLLMSIAMCPWALMSGATSFIAVMSGYAVFLGPMTGLMVFDYFFVHKRKVKLSALYDGTPNSIYWYWKGLNWRTPIAWVLGVFPTFPGFLQSVGANVTIPLAWTRIYYLCWPLGFLISGTTYLIFCHFFPLDGIGEVDEQDIFGTFTDRISIPAGTEVEKDLEHFGHESDKKVEGDHHGISVLPARD